MVWNSIFICTFFADNGRLAISLGFVQGWHLKVDFFFFLSIYMRRNVYVCI